MNDADWMRTARPGSVIRSEPGEWHPYMPERLDDVVEGADTLNGAVREPLRELSVAIVEPGRHSSERTVGVRVVLEHASEDVERGRPRRAYGRSP